MLGLLRPLDDTRCNVIAHKLQQLSCLQRDAECVYQNLNLAGLDVSGVNLEESDVGPGRTALAAVASEPAAVDAVFSAPARSR